MKRLLFLLTVAIAAMTMMAAPVDEATALRKAKSFLTNELYSGKLMAPAALNPVLLKAEVGSTELNQPAYYIFNTSTTFIVVAGDDRAEEILMIGDAPLKDVNNLPLGLQDMLNQYKTEITFLQENPKVKVDPIVSPKNTPSLKATTIGPLLTCNWDQEAPYYNQCRFTYSGTTYQCLTGCPATSASMVLYYWKYPTGATGTVPAYTDQLDISSSSWSTNYKSFTYAALPSTTFDWANMLDDYTGSYTTDQGTAVATLMRYVGQAEKMTYGRNGSGISVDDAQNVADMFIMFGYDSSTTRLVKKTSAYSGGTTLYSDTEWAAMIQEEMTAGRPIVFMAVSSNAGGHAFNVDGYNSSTNKYHINFGWSGDGNAWCALNSFGYSSYNFSVYQQMVIGIQPPQTTDPTLTVDPTSLTFTGYTGETYTQTFTVTGKNLTGNVTLTNSGSVYSISPSTITATQAAAGATVTVTYKPTAAGTQTGTVTIASSGAESKTVSLTGTATNKPALTATPSSLTFTTSLGTAATKTFLLKGTDLTGNVTLSVSGTGFSIDKTSVTKNSATSGSTITVTYNPSAAGTHTGTITISSSDAETITVPLNGTANDDTPRINVNPTSLSFNAVTGETVTKTFTVSGANLTGNLTLTLNDENGVYAIDRTSVTANEAGNGVTVTVTYAPATFGNQNATVTISGGSASAVTVNLTGVATLTKYGPVMLEPNDIYVALTRFRAEWTDETPAVNVSSYTLEVSPKTVEPVLIGSVAGTDFSGSSTGYYDITLPAPWGGTNVRGGLNSVIYFRNNYNGTGTAGNITYTIPEGYTNGTFTMKITTASTSDGSGNLAVGTPQTASVNQSFTVGATKYWLVTASSGEKITITTTDANYSPDIAKIEVYSGDATPATLMATETGDANYRLIEGITPDKYYTVKDLAEGGTFLYRVKALYIDGTVSDWSNVMEVTLHENDHPYMLGDVNHDDVVDVNDVTMIIAFILGNENGICQICADVNEDGDIDVNDVTTVISNILNGN